MRNTRLAAAAHVLTVIAFIEEDTGTKNPVSSETLAESVNTNPIVVRKLLGSLRDAGLVTAQAGRHGGASLARPADQITLADVWRAVDETDVFSQCQSEPRKSCPIGSHIGALLHDVFEGVDASVSDELRKTKIADLVARARKPKHASKKNRA